MNRLYDNELIYGRLLTVDEPHPRKASFMTSDKLGRIRNELYELLREEVISAMGEDLVGGP